MRHWRNPSYIDGCHLSGLKMSVVIPLPYTPDLIVHYQSLAHLPGFALLESRDLLRGRYDIVTAYPYDQIQEGFSHGFFQRLQERLGHAASFSPLPFQGGAIGYLSYDFGATSVGIHKEPHSCNDLPLVSVGFYDWAIVTDHQKRCVHLLAANTKKETPSIVEEICVRWEKARAEPLVFSIIEPFKSLITKKDYQQGFAAIHEALRQGRAYQVNYTQPFLARYQGDSWELYRRVRASNLVPFGGFLSLETASILSFSPERFFSMAEGVIETSPIKGTAKRDSDPGLDKQLQEDLRNSVKDRAENVMIVDLLRNDLSKLAHPGSVQVLALCELQSFQAVHHLVSTITATSDATPFAVLEACFPGGSITGAPKREAMRIIAEQEPFARGLYCGSIFYASRHGRFDSNIAIRTVIAGSDSLYLAAGGGLMIDSQCEAEYQECFIKLEGIMKAL